MNAYAKDNQVRISVEFTLSGVDTDPSTVKCFYKNPSGIITTLTYGVDGTLIKDAPGKYHVDILASVAGGWFYRFEGSGTLIAASEDQFYVIPSQVV